MRGTTKLLVSLTVGLLVVTTSRVAAVDVVDGQGDLRTSIVIRTSPRTANHLDGVLIWNTVLELRQRSPTFRDLLDVLMASPRSLALLTPAPEIIHSEGLIGRTRFAAGPRHVVAFVDVVVERMNPSIRRLAIAHELAHVAEVACLGFVDSQEALQRRMAAHVGSSSARLGGPLETGFALETGQAIVREAEGRVAGRSQFARLARTHRLTSCPVRPMSEIPQIVGLGESGGEGSEGAGGVC